MPAAAVTAGRTRGNNGLGTVRRLVACAAVDDDDRPQWPMMCTQLVGRVLALMLHSHVGCIRSMRRSTRGKQPLLSPLSLSTACSILGTHSSANHTEKVTSYTTRDNASNSVVERTGTLGRWTGMHTTRATGQSFSLSAPLASPPPPHSSRSLLRVAHARFIRRCVSLEGASGGEGGVRGGQWYTSATFVRFLRPSPGPAFSDRIRMDPRGRRIRVRPRTRRRISLPPPRLVAADIALTPLRSLVCD